MLPPERSIDNPLELPLDLPADLKVYAPSVTSTYQIKDVAERSGFSPATLRYYEEIGLLPAATRTPAGYRRYDDRTLQRLAFISRAKQLGCTLDEISDLTVAWDGGQCGPVQDRLRTVVGDKIAGAQHQIAELVTLTSELRQAARSLETHRPDGPCDDTCGCVADAAAPRSQPVVLGRTVADPAPIDQPVACTLVSESMVGRLDEWQRMLVHVERREPIGHGIRATLHPAAPLDELVRLTTAEQDCCRFFSFAITVDTRGVAFEVTAPDDAQPVLHALFGDAS